MLRINGSDFYAAVTLLNSLKNIIEQNPDATDLDTPLAKLGKGTHPIIEALTQNLTSLCNEVKALGARLTFLEVQRMLSTVVARQKTVRQLAEYVSTIDGRLRDELSLISLYAIAEDKAKFLEPKEPLFGKEAIDRLPLAVPDIEDAGKCLAVNQGTAAVFHLMRVMEAALRALAKMLEIDYAPSWDAYIKKIDAKISAKRADKSLEWLRDEPFYREALGDLQIVKIAWRNPTMHIIRRYSPEEAEEIFRAVRGFIRRLAGQLPKSEIEKLID